MKIVLLVEGHSETYLRPFLKQWLDGQKSKRPIGLHVVNLRGSGEYLRDVAKRTRLHLAEGDTLAVFGLLDLYGLPIDFPGDIFDVADRVTYARQHVASLVNANDRPRFRQHFAVHELEAWLLSDRRLFGNLQLPARCERPEEINFDTPPAALLDQLMSVGHGKGYKKRTMAGALFPRLDPGLVYQKCPYFRQMMDDMLAVARAAP